MSGRTVEHPFVGRLTRPFHKGKEWRKQRWATMEGEAGGKTRGRALLGSWDLPLEQARSQAPKCQRSSELCRSSGLGFRPPPAPAPGLQLPAV